MDNEEENNEIEAFAVQVGGMFVIDVREESDMIDGKQITRIQLGYLDDGCKMFMTSDDAQKVADLFNGVVERVKFIDE